MRKINLLQIVLHLLATCFFAYSAIVFSRFYNLKLLNVTLENGVKNVSENPEKFGLTINDVWNFTFSQNLANLIGILVAFIISITISLKMKWPVINSIIVLIIAILLNKFCFQNLGWNNFSQYLTPGRFFDNLEMNILTSGIFLLTIGITIFITKFLKNKISIQYSK